MMSNQPPKYGVYDANDGVLEVGNKKEMSKVFAQWCEATKENRESGKVTFFELLPVKKYSRSRGLKEV